MNVRVGASGHPLRTSWRPGTPALQWGLVLATYATCAYLYATGKKHHFFYFDEWIYIENADRDRLEHLLRPYYWYFHPVSWRLYFGLLFRRWGPDPAVFLTAQVMLVWIGAALAHAIVHRVTRLHVLGFVCNLLYLSADATATDAYWKSCIAYPVAVCFELSFVWIVLEVSLARGGWLRLAGLGVAGIVAFSCAWMSRNNALLIPYAVLVLWHAGRARAANRVLVAFVVTALVSMFWYRLVLLPGTPGAVDVSRAYQAANLVAAWKHTLFGPPWRVDSELLSFVPGFRVGDPRFEASAVTWARFGVLLAGLASLLSLRHRGRPRERFVLFLFVVTAIQLTTAAPYAVEVPQVDRVFFEPAVVFALALTLSVAGISRRLGRMISRLGRRAPDGEDVASTQRGKPKLALAWASTVVGAVVLVHVARGLAGRGGGDEAHTRRWECIWRQTAVAVLDSGFSPIVIDTRPAGLVNDDLSQYVTMVKLFWRPLGVKIAILTDAAPAVPDTLRLLSAGRVSYVDFRQVGPDRRWSGPASCPLSVPSIASDWRPGPDDLEDPVLVGENLDESEDVAREEEQADPGELERFRRATDAELLEGVAGDAWRSRLFSVLFLGLRGPRAIPSLEALLASRDWYVREGAILGLARLGDAAIPVVARLVGSNAPRERELAAVILMQLSVHDPSALDQLARWLGHDDRWIRDSASIAWKRSRFGS